jgi:cytochrome c oxidase subunit 1
VFIAASVIVFLGNVVTSLRSGVPAGANPWNAGTLEWAVSSPPPGYNFHYLPVAVGDPDRGSAAVHYLDRLVLAESE